MLSAVARRLLSPEGGPSCVTAPGSRIAAAGLRPGSSAEAVRRLGHDPGREWTRPTAAAKNTVDFAFLEENEAADSITRESLASTRVERPPHLTPT
jgi:hypothetical protein